MTKYYKGQRIDELLGEIATIEQTLNLNKEEPMGEDICWKYASAWTSLALAKAKLTALQGESNE